jgi:hypothetical protein
MGLFSKYFGEKEPSDLFEFNRAELQKEISKVAASLYDTRHEEGHVKLVTFLEKSMNLEILALSAAKELTAEAYAYRRGKIDAIKAVLLAREQALANSKKAAETKGTKSPSDNPAKRSYLLRKKARDAGGVGISDY